jgi:hypothetical protein
MRRLVKGLDSRAGGDSGTSGQKKMNIGRKRFQCYETFRAGAGRYTDGTTPVFSYICQLIVVSL